MTAAECRTRIVEHLRGRGWVPVRELSTWMREELKLSRLRGNHELRVLMEMQQVERNPTELQWPKRNYEYRVVDDG